MVLPEHLRWYESRGDTVCIYNSLMSALVKQLLLEWNVLCANTSSTVLQNVTGRCSWYLLSLLELPEVEEPFKFVDSAACSLTLLSRSICITRMSKALLCKHTDVMMLTWSKHEWLVWHPFWPLQVSGQMLNWMWWEKILCWTMKVGHSFLSLYWKMN